MFSSDQKHNVLLAYNVFDWGNLLPIYFGEMSAVQREVQSVTPKQELPLNEYRQPKYFVILFRLRIFVKNTHVMQTKLTLSLEISIIEQAKLYAKGKGQSLSELIENYLKVVIDENHQKVKLSPSIKKLKGAVKLPANFDYKKELTNALSEKYEADFY